MDFQNLAESLLGKGSAGSFHDWASWYGDNQYRFTFWFLYLAAIGDDLGIPNFKTLGRWLGRKVRNRNETTAAPSAPPEIKSPSAP